MKKAVIILSAIALLACNPTKHSEFKMLKNDKEYTVWETMRMYYDNDEGFEIEKETLYIDYDFIKSLPQSLKTIIAGYSPVSFMDDESRQNLAQALGDFSTLEEAQTTLLKILSSEQKSFCKESRRLVIWRTEELLFLKYGGCFWDDCIDTDEFQITDNEQLLYIKPKPIE